MSHWREKASSIVAEVLQRTAGQPEEVRKKALHDAYPFGERRYHPYKIWLDEIRAQRGGRPSKGSFADRNKLAEWEALYGKRSS